MSSIDGDGHGFVKIGKGNFNEYQHVYNDLQSNEANVKWITKLRDNENKSTLTISRINGRDSPDKINHTLE
jgi:hypothetical protein